MIKVSITLPNNAQITLESEEPGIIHEIVGIVLRDLPRELMASTSVTEGGTQDTPPIATTPPLPQPEAANAAEPSSEATPDPIQGTRPQQPEIEVSATEGHRDPGMAAPPRKTSGKPKTVTNSETEFIKFCQAANPMGDMRRVVVAAYGASQFLNQPSVDTQELGRLFQLVGWQSPHNLVQTLRNAARSKFRWMERIPGRSGHYSATEVGRATVSGG